jgi:hypothetical protein
VLAQYGPLPASLPYWVHAALTVPILGWVLLRGAETVSAGGTALARDAGAAWPRATTSPRFRRLIVPTAPWIFGAAGVAYATVPEAIHGQVRSWALLYAALLTVCAMAAGFLIQPLAQRLHHPVIPRSLSAAMVAMTAGMALAAATVALQSPWLGLLCAIVLGSALGLTLVSGLGEVQRLAPAGELAQSTGIFYALAYVGFLAPMLIALWGQTTAALWLATVLAGVCGLWVGVRSLGVLRAATV